MGIGVAMAPRTKKEIRERVHSALYRGGFSYCMTYKTKTTNRLRYHPRDKSGFRFGTELDPFDEEVAARCWYVTVFTGSRRVGDLTRLKAALDADGIPTRLATRRWRKSKRVYILWPLDEYDNVVERSEP